jgi:hypothetical protein
VLLGSSSKIKKFLVFDRTRRLRRSRKLPKPLIADSTTGITTLLMQRRKERLDVTFIVDQIFESMDVDQILEYGYFCW